MERQQGCVMIKLPAGESAVAGTGLSVCVSMNWKGEAARGANGVSSES